MAPDVNALYREVILEHSRRPHNLGRLAAATHGADGVNQLCGDRIQVDLALEGETIVEARFEGAACAIATASASLMTEVLRGKTRPAAFALLEQMREICGEPRAGERARAPRMPQRTEASRAGEPSAANVPADAPSVGFAALSAFQGVRAYPSRVRCAMLAWETMWRALAGTTG